MDGLIFKSTATVYHRLIASVTSPVCGLNQVSIPFFVSAFQYSLELFAVAFPFRVNEVSISTLNQIMLYFISQIMAFEVISWLDISILSL